MTENNGTILGPSGYCMIHLIDAFFHVLMLQNFNAKNMTINIFYCDMYNKPCTTIMGAQYVAHVLWLFPELVPLTHDYQNC